MFALVLASLHASLWSVLATAAGLAVLGFVGAADDAGGGGGEGEGGDGGGDLNPADGGDAGAGGGDPDPGDDGDPDPDRQAAGDGDPDPDDDDDDDGLPEEARNDPAKLRTHLRRVQRRNRAARPIVERFRARDGSGHFLPVQEIDRILGRAEDMRELEDFFAENADILTTIMERKQGKGRAAAASADDDEVFQDPFADPDKVPWDTTTESGRALVELFRGTAKENFELKKSLRRVERQVGDVSQRDESRTLGQVESTWKTATLAAAKQVPEFARPTFVRAVQRAFEIAKRDKTLTKVNAARIIQEELAPFVRHAKGQQRKTAAGQQQRAEGNQKLPRAGGQGRTTPVGASDSDKSKGTVRDGRKSFFARLGMSTPPSR